MTKITNNPINNLQTTDVNNINKPSKINFPNKGQVNQNQQIANLINKVQKGIDKALNIAVKIVRNEPVTKEELKFIKSKYPEILFSSKNYSAIVNEFKNLAKVTKNLNQLNNLHQEAKESISKEFQNQPPTNIETKMKGVSIEEVNKFTLKIKAEVKTLETLINKLLYSSTLTKEEAKLLESTYKNLKEYINEYTNTKDSLKSQLKTSDFKSKESIIKNELENIKNSTSNNLITKEDASIKKLIIEKVVALVNKDFESNHKTKVIIDKLVDNQPLNDDEIKLIKQNKSTFEKALSTIIKEYKNIKEEVNVIDNSRLIDGSKAIDNSKIIENSKLLDRLAIILKDIDTSPFEANIIMCILDKFKEDENTELNNIAETLDYVQKNLIAYLNPLYYFLSKSSNVSFSILLIVVTLILIFISL